MLMYCLLGGGGKIHLPILPSAEFPPNLLTNLQEGILSCWPARATANLSYQLYQRRTRVIILNYLLPTSYTCSWLAWSTLIRSHLRLKTCYLRTKPDFYLKVNESD